MSIIVITALYDIENIKEYKSFLYVGHEGRISDKEIAC